MRSNTTAISKKHFKLIQKEYEKKLTVRKEDLSTREGQIRDYESKWKDNLIDIKRRKYQAIDYSIYKEKKFKMFNLMRNIKSGEISGRRANIREKEKVEQNLNQDAIFEKNM